MTRTDIRPTPPAPLALPSPDAIRAAIDAADERARLLRLSLRLHAAPADAPIGAEVAHAAR